MFDTCTRTYNYYFQGAPVRFRKIVRLPSQPEQRIEPGESAFLRVLMSGPPTGCDYRAPKAEAGGLEEIPEEPPRSQSPPGESFSAQVVAKYSGAPDESKGYSRQLTQRFQARTEFCSVQRTAKSQVSNSPFQVTLLPSVMVSWWDVLPGESAEECYLVLDVCNQSSSSECELTYGEQEEEKKKHLVVDAGGRCRVPLPARKVPCEEVLQAEQEVVAGSRERRREKFLAEYLDRHVDLR